MTSLATLPAFAAYFVTALALAALFLFVYVHVTPHSEFALIRAGNAAAALSLGAALVGFCLPLASVIAHSAGLLDVAVWAVVAMIAQIVGFFIVRFALPGLCPGIERGDWASAISLAALSLAIGVLNAACMVY